MLGFFDQRLAILLIWVLLGKSTFISFPDATLKNTGSTYTMVVSPGEPGWYEGGLGHFKLSILRSGKYIFFPVLKSLFFVKIHLLFADHPILNYSGHHRFS